MKIDIYIYMNNGYKFIKVSNNIDNEGYYLAMFVEEKIFGHDGDGYYENLLNQCDGQSSIYTINELHVIANKLNIDLNKRIYYYIKDSESRLNETIEISSFALKLMEL